MKYATYALIGAMTLGLSACETAPTQQQTGAVVGGVLGGMLGKEIAGKDNRTAAIIAGTLIGGAIGGAIGRNMDETDQLRLQSTLERTPDYQTSTWVNPNTGYQYQATPVKTYQQASYDCREYRMNAMIDGRNETIVGTACRDAQGRWVNQ
jgi:surface antigen